MSRSDPIVTMNVALPASLKAYVGRRVANGEYVSASEYIRELIRVARDAQLNHILIESEPDYVRRLREQEEANAFMTDLSGGIPSTISPSISGGDPCA